MISIEHVIVFVNIVSYICSENMFVFYGNYGNWHTKNYLYEFYHIGSFDLKFIVCSFTNIIVSFYSSFCEIILINSSGNNALTLEYLKSLIFLETI